MRSTTIRHKSFSPKTPRRFRSNTQRQLFFNAASIAIAILALTVARARGQAMDSTETTAPATEMPAPAPLVAADQHFVPNTKIAVTGDLQLETDAIVPGPEIRLRQICSWSLDQSGTFAPIADLVIDRVPSKQPTRITLNQVRSTLADAGVSVGMINFTGSTRCAVSFLEDANLNNPVMKSATPDWLKTTDNTTAGVPADGANTGAADSTPVSTAVHRKSSVIVPDDAVPTDDSSRTLKALLVNDLSQRLNLEASTIDLNIDGKAADYLKLAEPIFHFDISPKHVRDLGQVAWEVTIRRGDYSQKVQVTGEARAWENQLLLIHPVSMGEVLRDEDFNQRRVLMDHLDDDALLTRSQLIDQQASRDLRTGTVMTARLVNAVPLAHPGQIINITLNRGGVHLTTSARAMETGSYGQSIRCKNEATGETYQAKLISNTTAVMGDDMSPASKTPLETPNE